MKKAFCDVYEVILWLKKNGPEVGRRGRAGDAPARAVMDAYTMVYNAPLDQAAQALLIERANEYVREHEEGS